MKITFCTVPVYRYYTIYWYTYTSECVCMSYVCHTYVVRMLCMTTLFIKLLSMIPFVLTLLYICVLYIYIYIVALLAVSPHMRGSLSSFLMFACTFSYIRKSHTRNLLLYFDILSCYVLYTTSRRVAYIIIHSIGKIIKVH